MARTKYIFVIGGVLSGVGKGVTTASIGRILQNRGLAVSAIKIDPYINADAGTMNPTVHGEVFVTDDADEVDEDGGNYERFLNIDFSSTNYMTTGRVYLSVIEKERSMYYGGRCVEVVPHIPLEVIERVKTAAKKSKADVMMIEIGGTVGEYQNLLFLEAARMMKYESPDDVAFVLVSYLPVPSHLGEMKTKPTQYAARTLNGSGIQADFVVARGKFELDKPRREKLALFCGLRGEEDIISAPDTPSIYDVPHMFEKQKLEEKIAKRLRLRLAPRKVGEWDGFIKKMHAAETPLKIAVVGKYFGSGDFTVSDSYTCVMEAIKHACWNNGARPDMTWIDSEDYEKTKDKVNELKNFDAVIVPGGFGTRGIEGIISAIRFVRENGIPYLGLCYGMQLASIEFARNILGIKNAYTVEVDPQAKEPIIHINPKQADNVNKHRYGGTMRLGAYDCALRKGSRVRALYGQDLVSERHRHRYEFNNIYLERFEKAGMQIVGINPETDLVEIIELSSHPYFVGCRYHPEFKSRPLKPHPLFVGLVRTALLKKQSHPVRVLRRVNA